MRKIKSLTMTIACKTLTDNFTMQTYDVAEIDQIFTVTIKDFAYTFKAAEISNSNGLHSVTGMYDIDDILNKKVAYTVNENYTAINIMTAISQALGKNLNIKIDDFSPERLPFDAVGREAISKLFSWTDKNPNRLINVFIRNDIINVIQRGKETSVLPLTKVANPVINKKRIKTLLDPKDSAGNDAPGIIVGKVKDPDPEDSEIYISGTFKNGDSSITYANGLVVQEKHTVKDFEEITNYSYTSSTPPAYLSSKNATTADGRVKVTYFYDDEKLAKEVEEHYVGETLDMKRITRHYPLGQGLWGTSIEEDGVTTYGGISQGTPGGKASPYGIRVASQKPSTTSVSFYPPTAALTSAALAKYAQDYPVIDNASLQAIADSLEWLNNKIEERVRLECYDDTIFDFNNRILWNGKEYYLESNSISVEAELFVQRLELIRWV